MGPRSEKRPSSRTTSRDETLSQDRLRWGFTTVLIPLGAEASDTLEGSEGFKVISSESGFAELGGAWDDLVRAMPRPSPFLLHAWLLEWFRHYGGASELAVQAVFRDGALVGAFPLVHKIRRGLRVARFMGGEQSSLADLLLAPSEDPTTGAALIERASSEHDFAELFGLGGDSRIARAAPERLHLFRRADAPVLELTGDWDAQYQAKVSSKRRSQYRRSLRQLEERGSVEFSLAGSREALELALGDTFRLHALRWEARGDGSGFATTTGVSFHRAALGALADQDVVRLMTMRFAGRAIAFALAFVLGARIYGYRMAFDPSFARYSPGILNLVELLGSASQEGLRRVEFLGAADRFKLELADDLEPLHLGLGLAATPRGHAVVTTRSSVRRLRERLKHSATARRAYDSTRPLLERLARPKDVLKG
jgi:CelD/BcsL family acetyltransferase involved in cellulose biosynthesis